MNPLLVEAILTMLFSYFLYSQYSSSSVGKPISIIVILAWFLTFFGIFILPLDIYYSSFHKNSEESEEILKLIKILWNILYWTVYVLSWLVIPIFQEYEASGDLTFIGKLKRSLKRNLIFYLIIFLVGSIFVGYLLIREKFTL